MALNRQRYGDDRSDAERRMFVRPGFDGAIFTRGRAAVFLVKSGVARAAIVTHGLVRVLAIQLGLAGKAPWFDEGLARYLEQLKLDEDGALSYGQVDSPLYTSVTRGRLTSFENLWTPPTTETRATFIATSWLAVQIGRASCRERV